MPQYRIKTDVDERLNRERALTQIEQERLTRKKLKQAKAYLNRNLRSTRRRRRGWTTPGTPDRDMSKTDRQSAMAMARQKVEEMPLALGIVQTLADNIIGRGFRLSARTADKDFNAEVEKRWQMACEKLDIRGVRGWGQLQRMWYMRKFIDGDCGIRLIDGGNEDERALSYVATYEAERIYKQHGTQDDGVEFDRFGRPTKYYVGPRVKSKTDTKSKTEKGKAVPAKDFILYANYPHERAERARGVTQFLQSFALLEDLDRTTEAMVQKVENEAFIGLKFTTEPSTDGAGPFGGEVLSTQDDEEGTSRQHVKIVPGLNLNLIPGEDADVMESKSPNSEFIPFIRFILRHIGASVGLPLELLLMDFSDTNYSGGRALMEIAKKRYQIEQAEMERISSRIYQWWLSREVKYNGLEVPKKIKASFWKHSWGKPGWPYLDPMKEVQAQGLMIDRGLKSRQDVLSELGESDFEDVATQISRENELMEELNLPRIIGIPGVTVLGGENNAD